MDCSTTRGCLSNINFKNAFTVCCSVAKANKLLQLAYAVHLQGGMRICTRELPKQTLTTTHCYFTRLSLKKWGLSNFAFSIARNSTTPYEKRIFEILRGILEIIQFILSDKHLDGAGRSLRHYLDKVRKWHFHSTSNEVIWPKKISNSMHGSKSAHTT